MKPFGIWDRDKIRPDIVWVLRKFRPDVVVTRFSPEDGLTTGIIPPPRFWRRKLLARQLIRSDFRNSSSLSKFGSPSGLSDTSPFFQIGNISSIRPA